MCVCALDKERAREREGERPLEQACNINFELCVFSERTCCCHAALTLRTRRWTRLSAPAIEPRARGSTTQTLSGQACRSRLGWVRRCIAKRPGFAARLADSRKQSKAPAPSPCREGAMKVGAHICRALAASSRDGEIECRA